MVRTRSEPLLVPNLYYAVGEQPSKGSSGLLKNLKNLYNLYASKDVHKRTVV